MLMYIFTHSHFSDRLSSLSGLASCFLKSSKRIFYRQTNSVNVMVTGVIGPTMTYNTTIMSVLLLTIQIKSSRLLDNIKNIIRSTMPA